MTTPSDGPNARRWRSRAFMQPLLVWILGLWVVPILVYALWASARSGSDASTCTGECGTARVASAFTTGFVFLLAWLVLIVVVGFIVGHCSRDFGSRSEHSWWSVLPPLWEPPPRPGRGCDQRRRDFSDRLHRPRGGVCRARHPGPCRDRFGVGARLGWADEGRATGSG